MNTKNQEIQRTKGRPTKEERFGGLADSGSTKMWGRLACVGSMAQL